MLYRENNFAFIDSQNLNLAIKAQGWKLDYKKFRRYLLDRFLVTEAFLFVGYIPKNQFMYTFFEKIGYTLIFKPTLLLPNRKVKGNVDAELVLQTMIEYDNYDAAVIVSGDGDFYCLVQYLNKNLKLKRLIVPNKYRYSSLLRGFSDNITFLNGTQEKLGIKKEA